MKTTIVSSLVASAAAFAPASQTQSTSALMATTPAPFANEIGDDFVIDQTGRCICGAVEFHAKGKLAFSELCHCRACAWAASVTPVHVIGVEISELDYKTGKDKVVVVNGLGKMIHGRCSQCMTQVFQKPQGENYVALFPPTFRIGGDDSLEQKLPDYYLPRMHTNYENRARDATDSLPKFKTFPPDNEVNADGSLKNAE
ncbi:Glutathione-dependent formaldehyde-activating enzyme [Seminavis robusta]|uniref:Glutathione-dependent formaldehyde-activating enzyme n=1 Tax=Seminavis robusta TaxID=568900 RepID=A0A9N8EWX6_9STRA|nr:Glutathione-dependent formaldehyde-activating enzyme [Seminavis robusta]|eukprot:Sro1942_g306780.1 Glutathione-dependent formaldehyde-activating enzyme (200) ;mRNA; r:12475-13074